MSGIVKTKERLKSTKSTQKVIKAMELVASSKIKKAKDKVINNNNYFFEILDIMNYLKTQEEIKKQLDNNEQNELIITLTSDMGLCGGYNNNVLKTSINYLNKNSGINFIIGNKGITKYDYEKINYNYKIEDSKMKKDYELALEMTEVITTLLKEKKINNVKLIYMRFVNPLVQEVDILDLFKFKKEIKEINEYIVAGDRKMIMEELVEQYIVSVCYNCVLNARASEYAARRNSMEAANNNSLELIEKLDGEINRIRQAMITQEISEIIGGAEALKE